MTKATWLTRRAELCGLTRHLLASPPTARVADHVTLLFGELTEEVEQSLDDKEAAAAEGGGGGGGSDGWKEVLEKLQRVVMDEFDAANQRNASQAAEVVLLKVRGVGGRSGAASRELVGQGTPCLVSHAVGGC